MHCLNLACCSYINVLKKSIFNNKMYKNMFFLANSSWNWGLSVNVSSFLMGTKTVPTRPKENVFITTFVWTFCPHTVGLLHTHPLAQAAILTLLAIVSGGLWGTSVQDATGLAVALMRGSRAGCTTRMKHGGVNAGLAWVVGVVWGASRQLRECSCWRYAAKQYQLAGVLNFSPTGLMKSWKVSWLPHMALFSATVRRTITHILRERERA